ncbi:hypothetical protein [Dyella sp. 20L07]|uniref:hypothetical protein n=1 Tax=Dyella sp. 20L07 TaxID=3384240 RepID=UPI003D279B67
MLVTGTVELLPDGSVRNYTLYKAEKLPAPVVELIKRNVATWKFQFKEPHTSPIQEDMSLRVIAKDADDHQMTLRLAGVEFSDKDKPEGETIQWSRRVQPTYPSLSLNNMMTGTVYVLLRVARDGTVADFAVEQVNLRRYVKQPYLMDRFRKDLADAATRVAKYWTFKTPTKGEDAQAPFWYVRVPINFGADMDNHSGTRYGSWEVYVRGPRESISWLQDPALLAEAPDATPDGAVHQIGSGAQLLTPPALN